MGERSSEFLYDGLGDKADLKTGVLSEKRSRGHKTLSDSRIHKMMAFHRREIRISKTCEDIFWMVYGVNIETFQLPQN
jgi:hypothetical protein